MWKWNERTFNPWMAEVWNSIVKERRFMPYNGEDWGLAFMYFPEIHV
jgi:hypothetical protein